MITGSRVAVFSYDAFISYSHKDDGKLAPALQAGLERFAKPWYRARALRVFLDTANLSANPGLWGSVVEALASSRWFVLLASPNSAKSEWVNREVAWWLENRSPERLLVAATSPGLAWDEQLKGWSAGALVPPALRAAFTEEPRWVNLAEIQRNERRVVIPAELIADIAAPILGQPKDKVIGDQLREHRRTMRLARGAVGILAVLTAAATLATFIAIGQRDSARAQARIATSREIAALAVASLGTNLGVAQLLAVAAYKMDRNPQTEAALFDAVTASPQLVRYLQAGAAVTGLAAAADAKAVVAGTANGELVLFDLATGTRRAVQAGHGPITDVAISADGSRVAAVAGSQAVAWAGGPGTRVRRFGLSRGASSVAVSPSGRLVAVLTNPNGSAGSFTSNKLTAPLLLVRDTQTGRRVRAAEPGWVSQIAFSGDSSLMLLGDGGSWKQVTAAGLRSLGEHSGVVTPNFGTPGTSPNGLFFGFVASGYVSAWRTQRPPSLRKLNGRTIGPDENALGLTISSDGKWAATIEGGSVYLARLPNAASGQVTASSPTELTSNSDTNLVSFLGDDSHLVSVSGNTLVLWNLNQASRAGRPTGVMIPDAAAVGGSPALALSPNGGELAIAGSLGGTLVCRVGPGLTRVSETGLEGNISRPIWQGNTALFAGLDDAGGLQITNEHGTVLRSLPPTRKQESPYLVAARLLPGGSRLAIVDDSGVTSVYNLRTRTVQTTHTGFSSPRMADISPSGNDAVILPWNPKVVLYIDLRTRKFHAIGSGSAAGFLLTRDRLLIQRASGTLETWDPTGKHLFSSLSGAGGFTGALAVSPNGTIVARVRDNGTVLITALTTGQTLGSFSLPFPVNTASPDPWFDTALLFTPNGKALLTATSGGEMMRWDVYPPNLAKIACQTAGRALTAIEWRAYVNTSPPADLACRP